MSNKLLEDLKALIAKYDKPLKVQTDWTPYGKNGWWRRVGERIEFTYKGEMLLLPKYQVYDTRVEYNPIGNNWMGSAQVHGWEK